MQQQDTNIEILKRKLQNNRLDKEYYSLDENELLTRKVIDGGHKFCAIYLPSVLIFQVLHTAHDDLGHNGFPRTYAAIKRVFFWKGMKEDIRKHCKTCATCQLHKLENVKFERKIFKPSLQPMDFICMDLIGEFHPPTSRGHRYALTAVCMLTGFTWCVPLKTKTAEEVAKAYMDHIYCSFGGSIKILTDNGTEFKNKLFKEVVSKLGTEFSIHSPPYRPQSNGKIEGFHRFLKTCIGKLLITDWSGMNSHQWQQHVTISSQTVVQESPHFLSCLEEIPSTSLTCYCMQLDAISMMIMDFPI